MIYVLAFILSPITWTVRGFVLSILWQWFVTPLGVAEIGIPTAIGIACVAGLLVPTNSRSDPNKSDERELVEAFIRSFVRPGFALLVGWTASLFLM